MKCPKCSGIHDMIYVHGKIYCPTFIPSDPELRGESLNAMIEWSKNCDPNNWGLSSLEIYDENPTKFDRKDFNELCKKFDTPMKLTWKVGVSSSWIDDLVRYLETKARYA